jgi:hypothetical protein
VTPHSVAGLTRYWLTVLFSALFPVDPANYPAHSHQSHNDLLRQRKPRVLDLGSKRHQHLTKVSLYRRGSRALTPKTPKPTSDEYSHAADNPAIRHINNPCSYSSQVRSNDEFNVLVTAIDQQTDVLRQVLSSITTLPQTQIEPPTLTISALMPRPGQPGSLLVFTGNDVSNYLDEYNAKCEFYSVRPDHRAIHFPRYYCTSEIKEIAKLLPGYESRDWSLLQCELKKFYWQYDRLKNSVAALNALIRSSNSIALNVFVLKFFSITDALVTQSFLSPVNRVVKLLEGLDNTMRLKVIKFCTQRDWKVTSVQDFSGTRISMKSRSFWSLKL